MLNLKNENGNATLEMIPVLILFILLLNFGLGFFGIIHSGILNSIAARNYTFETFRNRCNLNYLRDEGGDNNPYYSQMNFRFHGITEEGAPINTWTATKRPLKFTDLQTGVNKTATAQDHNSTVRSKMSDDTKKTSDYFDGVSPVWIMTQYGICLNSICEG